MSIKRIAVGPRMSQAVVHGDRRPYPVALITLNAEELAKFAREQGILAAEPAVLVKHPKVIERVQRTVDEKNSELQSYAKIKKFLVLPEDFTVENGAGAKSATESSPQKSDSAAAPRAVPRRVLAVAGFAAWRGWPEATAGAVTTCPVRPRLGAVQPGRARTVRTAAG